MTRYVVTEGPNDTEVLQDMLQRAGIMDVQVLTATGSAGALSKARSLMVNRKGPVVLVIDEMNDRKQDAVREEYEFLMSAAPASVPSKVVVYGGPERGREELDPVIDFLRQHHETA